MTTLSAINFVAPAMFFGLGLLTLPIAAHLLNRRARRRVVFPTVMLLLEASASQSQLFKLRRLILLALRCLAVLLLVLAFAQPIWRQRAGAGSTAGRGSAAVLIVDQSASTGQRVAGLTALRSLTAAAGQALDGLAPGTDVADIIFAAGHPRPAFPGLTGNLEALRQALAEMAPTSDRADLPAAVALAGTLLQQHQGPHHLVILTDLQATNWADVEASLSAGRPLPPDTQVRIVHPPAAPPGNLGLATPVVRPARPVVSQPTYLTVSLTNFGEQGQTASVAMAVDGRQVEAQSVSLGPWQQRELSFAFQFAAPGGHEVAFALPSDALEIDNQVYLIVRVAARLSTVVIGDDDPDEPGSAAYFTVRALAPRDGEQDRHEVRHVRSAHVSTPALAGAAAVFVTDCAEFDRPALEALQTYLHEGGGIVFFCGDGPVDRNLAALDDLAEDGLLPWELGPRRDVGMGGDLLSLGEGDWRSPLLSAFDVRSREALGQIRFSRVWSVGAVHPETLVLLRYSDGSGALGLRQVGAGRLAVAGFSPAQGRSDLAKHGAFVALMHSLVQGLQPRQTPGTAPTVGHSVTFVSDAGGFDPAGSTVRVVAPDGKAVGDVDLSSVSRQLTTTILNPALPGFYRAVQGDQSIGAVAVNLDKRESDLRRLEAATLTEALRHQGADVAVLESDDRHAVLDTQGRPFWGAMLAAALLVLGIELALLGYWKR